MPTFQYAKYSRMEIAHKGHQSQPKPKTANPQPSPSSTAVEETPTRPTQSTIEIPPTPEPDIELSVTSPPTPNGLIPILGESLLVLLVASPFLLWGLKRKL